MELQNELRRLLVKSGFSSNHTCMELDIARRKLVPYLPVWLRPVGLRGLASQEAPRVHIPHYSSRLKAPFLLGVSQPRGS